SHPPDPTYVDVAAIAARDLLRALDGLLLGGALDQVEAAEGLLGLGERAVHDLSLAGLDPDPAGFAVGPESLAVDHLARRLELLGEAPVALHDRGHFGLGRLGLGLLVTADEQHVTHRILLDDVFNQYDDDDPSKSTRGLLRHGRSASC